MGEHGNKVKELVTGLFKSFCALGLAEGDGHEVMIIFMKESRSCGNKNAKMKERKIGETLGNIQNSFHSVVNAVTALERKRKHNEIVITIKPGGEERRLWDHIVRIIILLKRWLLQIEQVFCIFLV